MKTFMREFLTVLAAGLLGTILVGCTPAGGGPGPVEPEETPGPAGVPVDLVSSEWILVEIDGRPALEEAVVTLSFPNPGELSGNGGCNNYFSDFSLTGEVISIPESGFQTTSQETMGCGVPESVMEQETAYFSALKEAALIRTLGERLALLDSSGQTRLVFERREPVVIDPALSGAAWELVSLHGMPLLPDTYISLEFVGQSGGGSAGCNSYGGALVEANEGRLSFSEIMSTAMLCQREDGTDVMQQEADYLGALKNSASYQIQEGQLQLFDASGNPILLYRGQERIPMDPSSLAGSAWQLLSFDREPVPEVILPTLAFSDAGRVSGNSGCRDFTGAYHAEGDRIRFPEYGMVQLDCLKGSPGRGMEANFMDALSSASRYHLEPERLVLYTSRGNELVFGPHRGSPAGPAGRSDWRLVAFLDGEAETPPLAGSEISLSFSGGTLDRSGNVSGSAGCNQFSSTYTYDGSAFRFGPAGATKMACMDPPGIMEQEQRFLGWLEEVVLYWIEGERLFLQTGDGRALVFEGDNGLFFR
jgi:heat shock protein HslJ